mgnify:CR=1 FL=1
MINLQALYKEYEDDNHIDSSLYAEYRVKSGLRNEKRNRCQSRTNQDQ